MACQTCGGPTLERLVRIRRGITAALYVAGFALAFGLAGSFLHDMAEGVRRGLLPVWHLWMPLAVLFIAGLVTVARFRRPMCDKCGAVTPGWLFGAVSIGEGKGQMDPSTRRKVLRGLGAIGAGTVAAGGGLVTAIGRNRGWVPIAKEFFFTEVEKTAPSARPEWRGATIKTYRRLGRTNAMVSDISLGSGRINDAEVARQAIERGINYFDTAPDYADTASERVLGQAMKGRREKVFLATKFCVADGHLPNDTPVPKIIEAVEGSLRRLQTDYVDLIHIHSCDRLDRLLAPNIHEAFDRLKQQGKARFLGVSTHTPNLAEIANAAVDSGRFDVIMLAYHFGMWSGFEHILEKAKAHDVGVVAMKTLKGAKHADLAKFRDQASAYSQAAFRWVLSNPSVSCLVVSFFLPQHVDEYIYASGTAVRPTDVALLRRYDQLIAGDYCQPHCGGCLASCAHDLPINDILRYRMYVKDYGWTTEGVRRYANLERDGSLCTACPAPCAQTCPIGVPIREKMMDAHRVLA